ncbi:adhesion domain-containing protein, partial [Salmonella enterica]|uniref:adhesion domain-containing protein n=1 Tax=Salmonella enterica TaxID=28901 RepID=UPI003F1A25AF
KTDPAVNSAAGYFPSVEALDSHYSKYPNRTIKTAQGRPINRSYWSGSSSGSLTGGKPRSYYIVDQDDDSRRGVVTD